MSFHGDAGHLSPIDAAIEELKDLEQVVDMQDLRKWFDLTIPYDEKQYKRARTLRMIEGLQMVILKNGGSLNFSRLPLLWEPVKSLPTKQAA